MLLQTTRLKHYNRHTANMSFNSPSRTLPPDPSLETLKAIRDSAYARWEKRRDYEWKLSFGIWTALATFIAIVLSRDLKIVINDQVMACAVVCGLLIVGCHAFYLVGIIEHTIADVDTQYLVEQSLAALLKQGVPNPLPQKTIREQRVWKRVGYFQAGITLILVLAALLSMLAPRVPVAK